jgi:hypothetical protein
MRKRLFLAAVSHFSCGNCLSQNQKLFGYFLAAKSNKWFSFFVTITHAGLIVCHTIILYQDKK